MKKVGTDNKIREWFHDYESVDYTNVFDLYVPSELNLGKNQIKIDLVGNKLQKGSPLSIDIIDGLGVPIYHEISSIVNTDKTRSIVVWIYDDTAAGNCTLYISCYLGGNFDGKKYLYKKGEKEKTYITNKNITNQISISKRLVGLSTYLKEDFLKYWKP